jgi:hypothetical protein
MAKQAPREIVEMDWETLEDRLQASNRGTKRAVSGERPLREYFGDEEFKYLRKLADHVKQVRTRAPALIEFFLSPLLKYGQESIRER